MKKIMAIFLLMSLVFGANLAVAAEQEKTQSASSTFTFYGPDNRAYTYVATSGNKEESTEFLYVWADHFSSASEARNALVMIYRYMLKKRHGDLVDTSTFYADPQWHNSRIRISLKDSFMRTHEGNIIRIGLEDIDKMPTCMRVPILNK